MNRRLRMPLLILFCCALAWNGAGAQREASGQERNVDPRADALLRELGENAGKNKHFRFVLSDTIDEVRDSGQKIQFSHRRFGTVSRPDKLKLRSVGDTVTRTVLKDGMTITLLDEDHNVYTQIEDPGTIDDMMDLLLERYGVSMPLADLLSGNLYEVLTRGVLTGEYVGLHHVGELRCHHLAFTQAEIDWQVWIDAGESPALRKLVITYKQMPGEPQYVATLQSFTKLAEEPTGEFRFQPPPGADRIEILPIEKDSESKRTSEE